MQSKPTQPTLAGAPVKVKILIAEDNDDIRETLRFLLAGAGYHVEEAINGEQALRALQAAAEPCIALLDLTMPRLSGMDVLRAIAEEAGALRHRFILLTARQAPLQPTDMEVLAQLDTPIVYKPFDIDDVLASVQLAEKRLQEGE